MRGSLKLNQRRIGASIDWWIDAHLDHWALDPAWLLRLKRCRTDPIVGLVCHSYSNTTVGIEYFRGLRFPPA